MGVVVVEVEVEVEVEDREVVVRVNPRVELELEEALEIWACTVELKVPVIPLKENLAEKERYGFAEPVWVSEVEEKRIK